jgi:ATP-dependent Clp protease ATP-binding subunit ClpC
MFQRYTEQARRGIFRARYEATRYGTEEIDDVELLLGVLTADGALAERLEEFGVTIAMIREQFAPTQERIATNVDLTLSGHAKTALMFTTEEADRIGAIEIDTSHVVTALARTESSRAAEILAVSGLTPERLREILFHGVDACL